VTFTAAFRTFGPDVQILASALGIAESSADSLKNWMMDNKPLDALQAKSINARCRRMVARHALRAVREQHRVAA
jgi:hypothetical protein